MRLFLILVMLLSGCTTVVSQVPLQPPDSALRSYDSVDNVLRTHFTEKAYLAIRDIHIVRGITIRPFVSGVNFWSNLGSFLLGNGFGRQVVVDSNDLIGNGGFRTIIHEYMHHIDDMDRDGLLDLIDHREFAAAYFIMRYDPEYKDKVLEIDKLSDWFVTRIFGIGTYSEEIAYVGSWLVQEGGPDYMWHVFRHILKPPKATHS